MNPQSSQFLSSDIKYHIVDIYFEENETVKKGNLLFSYLNNKNEELKYFSDFEGKILSSNLFLIINKHYYIDEIWWQVEVDKNGCTTHPHNFYLQLISETGFIGFMFLTILFVYLVFSICKNFIYTIFLKKRSRYTNFQICLLLGFIVTLLPIIPNGNFFNNWLSMIMFLPVGFYIYSIKVDTK
jgi:hypothetical protein